MTCEANKSASVWLIGGTSESAELALALEAQRVPFIVSVTTEAARRLYPAIAQVVVGALSRPQMAEFVQRQQVKCVLDASHPFAASVSEGAIATALSLNIAYIRYERSLVSSSTSLDISPQQCLEGLGTSHKVSFYTSVETLLNISQLRDRRILFTLGYRTLLRASQQLAQLRQTSQLFVRILPSPAALSAALTAGFNAREIAALRPPITYELEKALWQQWNISAVIAKASGEAGGEATKRRLAAELGVELRLLKRPPVAYPHQTSCLSEAVSFCQRQLSTLSLGAHPADVTI